MISFPSARVQCAASITMRNSVVSKKSVIVGMSGGVDSSVTAHLLIQQGYAVEGLFMKNWDEDDGTEYCTAIADLEDAQRVCDSLNIPLHTANFAAEYWDNVFEDFLRDYRHGRTPNPDVLCNREIKFKQFADYAKHLGGDYIATGHYARIKDSETNPTLLKGVDDNKDQSYFLQAVPRHALVNCLFPLGDWLKRDVREYAEQHGLHNANRKDSTGICFIGERRFADFIDQYISGEPGPMKDTQGRVIGEHSGLHHFTVGQRQGLAIGGLKGRPEKPWYVVRKDTATNSLIVTQNEADLAGTWLHATEANWLVDCDLPITCTAKIRYRQEDQACEVRAASNGTLSVRFREPQRGIAPGQFIAFYDHDMMLGGARIDVRAES